MSRAASPRDPMAAAVDPRLLGELYRVGLRIRRVEERIRDLYAAGRMPGFIHLSLGQEAVAAGACLPLRREEANVPVPFAPVLEAAVSPQVGTIVGAVRRVLHG